MTSAEAASQGGFVYVKESCQATCLPEQPCKLPFVPVVTQDVFTCQALSGFADFPAPDDVSFTGVTPWPPMCLPMWRGQRVASLPPSEGQLKQLTLADLDGDSKQDLFVSWQEVEEVRGGGRRHHRFARVFTRTATGFEAGVASPVASDPRAPLDQLPIPSAVHRRGSADRVLAVLLSEQPGWRAEVRTLQLEQGAITLSEPLFSVCALTQVGDFDGDGFSDVLSAGEGDCATFELHIHRGVEPGFVDGAPLPFDTSRLQGMLIGDVDGDGSDDLLVGTNPEGYRWIRGAGTPTATALPATGLDGIFDGLVDLDGDHHADAWVLRQGPESSSLEIRFGDGAGGFSAPSVAPQTIGQPCAVLATGTFSGDALEVLEDCPRAGGDLGLGLIGASSQQVASLTQDRRPSLRVKGGAGALDLDGDGQDELIILDSDALSVVALRRPR